MVQLEGTVFTPSCPHPYPHLDPCLAPDPGACLTPTPSPWFPCLANTSLAHIWSNPNFPPVPCLASNPQLSHASGPFIWHQSAPSPPGMFVSMFVSISPHTVSISPHVHPSMLIHAYTVSPNCESNFSDKIFPTPVHSLLLKSETFFLFLRK